MVSHALNEVANYVERIALVVERGFRIGTVAEIMTEETLSADVRHPGGRGRR